MDKQAAMQRLMALASEDKSRSKAARLRDLYPGVEVALSAGVSRARVVEELAALGLEMTPATFGTTLTRIRRERKASGARADVAPGAPSPPPSPADDPAAAVSEEPASSQSTRYDPVELRKVMNSTPDLNALSKAYKQRK